MPQPHRVAIVDAVDLLAPGIELLRSHGVEVSLPPGPEPSFIARCAGSPVAVVGLRSVNASELRQLAEGGTRLVIRPGIGYDIIDIAGATAAGIIVANVPDYCVDEVADHTLLLLLAAQRRLTALTGLWHSGWHVAGKLPPVSRIAGTVLGIIGLGRIGSAVARRATGFGWQVIAHDPLLDPAESEVKLVGLEELFRTASAITLHAPLTTATRYLVDAQRLQLIAPGTVLVNTSRGGLVDLDAVHAALAEGRLAAVALDVLDGEPDPPLHHPLLHRPDVIVTPHVAWYSAQAREELAIKTAQEALRWFSTGAVRHRVPETAR